MRFSAVLAAIAAVTLSLIVAGMAFAAYGHPPYPSLHLGTRHMVSHKAFDGFYDAHLDAYVNTDVSTKAQAKQLHANFAPVLARTLGKGTAPMYFVRGRSAAGQRAVFGSEPGESDYSPLWQEIFVRFKAGVAPVLLTSDNQIFSLQSKGSLSVYRSKIVLNAPITRNRVH